MSPVTFDLTKVVQAGARVLVYLLWDAKAKVVLIRVVCPQQQEQPEYAVEKRFRLGRDFFNLTLEETSLEKTDAAVSSHVEGKPADKQLRVNHEVNQDVANKEASRVVESGDAGSNEGQGIECTNRGAGEKSSSDEEGLEAGDNHRSSGDDEAGPQVDERQVDAGSSLVNLDGAPSATTVTQVIPRLGDSHDQVVEAVGANKAKGDSQADSAVEQRASDRGTGEDNAAQEENVASGNRQGGTRSNRSDLGNAALT